MLLDVENESSVIQILHAEYYRELKESKKIFAGMIPKLDNAFTAIRHGVHKVIIGKGEELDLLIAGNSGTTIRHA